uniref:hypothetical protein n=1 Tax=Burkholderia sp. GbtcB21 TaxID=2824766 RepID=UPI001C311504
GGGKRGEECEEDGMRGGGGMASEDGGEEESAENAEGEAKTRRARANKRMMKGEEMMGERCRWTRGEREGE